MVAWDLLNAYCCCPCQHSHSSGRLWQRQSQGRAQTAVTLQCWVCFQLCTGQEDQCSHQTTARSLCQSSVLNGYQASALLWHCRGECCSSSLALISSRSRRRHLVSHVHVQSQASTLPQSSLRLSRMISDKTGELKLPYVWFWMAALRFMCCKNGKTDKLLLDIPCPYIRLGVMGRMLFLAAAGVRVVQCHRQQL